MADAYKDAGRVLLLPKGTFAAGTAYNVMDYCIYAGSTYVCKAAVDVSNTATPDTDTTHWQMLAQGYDLTEVEALKEAVENEWEVVSTW